MVVLVEWIGCVGRVGQIDRASYKLVGKFDLSGVGLVGAIQSVDR